MRETARIEHSLFFQIEVWNHSFTNEREPLLSVWCCDVSVIPFRSVCMRFHFHRFFTWKYVISRCSPSFVRQCVTIYQLLPFLYNFDNKQWETIIRRGRKTFFVCLSKCIHAVVPEGIGKREKKSKGVKERVNWREEEEWMEIFFIQT